MSSQAPQIHVFPMRVYYEDTDAAGIVYYANYLKFAERARTEFLRGIGVTNSGLMADEGIVFAVRECHMDFQRPALLDDRLEVHSVITKVGGASLSADQIVRRDGEDLVRLEVRLACVTLAGRPGRLPKKLRAALQTFCSENDGG